MPKHYKKNIEKLVQLESYAAKIFSEVNALKINAEIVKQSKKVNAVLKQLAIENRKLKTMMSAERKHNKQQAVKLGRLIKSYSRLRNITLKGLNNNE